MSQKIYALLVGINDYPGTNRLNGCVNDVKAVENYLKEYFTEKNGFEIQINALPQQEATRDGIINAFKQCFGESKNGDVCFFYYSGHGDQFKTPQGVYSQDDYCQTLVCYIEQKRADIADKELGALIYEVTRDKEVHFVAITDCCHSGSNMRANIAVRSFDNRDYANEFRHIPLEEYVGFESAEKIDGKYKFRQAPYVHIASCRDSQKSIEKRIGEGFRGVFTYSMLDILIQKQGYINYENFTEQVKFAIKKHTSSQEPVLNKNAREFLLGQRQFLNNSKIITGDEPFIYYLNRTWKLNKGSLHGVVKGDIIKLKENGLENSHDAKVKMVDMDNAVIEINNMEIDSNENREKNNLPVTIDFSNKQVMELVIDNTATEFKVPLFESPQLQKLEFVSMTEGAPDDYYIGYDHEKKQLFLSNTGFDEPVIFSNKNAGTAVDFDLFLDNIDKYSRARYFSHFAGANNTELSNKYEIKLFLQQNDQSFKEVNAKENPVKIPVKDARANAAKIKIEVSNNSESTLYIRSAYTDASYGIQTDLHHELELHPGEKKYLEVKDTGTNRDITELFFDSQLLDNNITRILEQLKLLIANTTFGINGFAQEGIKLNACRPNGSKGSTFRAVKYNWVVENTNFEIEAI